MKTTHRIIVCLIALICFCAQRAAADSPLTSTDFHQAYADEPIVAQVEKGRTPSDETWAYLAAPDNPVAVKMAIINKIGWAFEGKNSYQLFLSYLKRQGICKREKDLYQKRPGDLLLSAAYLKAMDNYFNVEEAARMARRARQMHPDSYTVNIICALIEAQIAFDSDWGEVYRLTDAVRRNTTLKDDMNDEAKRIIFEYMDLYGSDA